MSSNYTKKDRKFLRYKIDFTQMTQICTEKILFSKYYRGALIVKKKAQDFSPTLQNSINGILL